MYNEKTTFNKHLRTGVLPQLTTQGVSFYSDSDVNRQTPCFFVSYPYAKDTDIAFVEGLICQFDVVSIDQKTLDILTEQIIKALKLNESGDCIQIKDYTDPQNIVNTGKYLRWRLNSRPKNINTPDIRRKTFDVMLMYSEI